MGRYDDSTRDALAGPFECDGFVMLREHFARETIRAWREAFEPLLKPHVDADANGNRGPGRYYVTLPFEGLFADASIFCDEDIVGIVERVAGCDPVMCQLATDTPVLGSTFQDWHRDTPALFDDAPETPSFQLAVNFPLVDVDDANGPLETTRGTHLMSRDKALGLFEAGSIAAERMSMQIGDVMIRDVRGLHRSTPNLTNEPRPMVVIGYSRTWYFRPEVHIDVPRAATVALQSAGRADRAYLRRKLQAVCILSANRFSLAALAADALIELRDGHRRVLLAPHVGGVIAAFYETRGTNVIHWLRPATREMLAARNPLGMASFPLLPYCNRIRDARFVFDGERVDLSNDGNLFPHALHGNAWRREWHVGEVSEASATLHLRHEPSTEPAHRWPFAYEATQHIALDPDALRVTMTMRNLSDRPMPFGIGHHPYFPRSETTVVHAQVDAMWHGTPDPLPTHIDAHPAVDALRSESGMRAGAFDLDNHFIGWQRTANIAWPDEHRDITLTADALFDFMVIYAPHAFPDRAQA